MSDSISTSSPLSSDASPSVIKTETLDTHMMNDVTELIKQEAINQVEQTLSTQAHSIQSSDDVVKTEKTATDVDTTTTTATTTTTSSSTTSSSSTSLPPSSTSSTFTIAQLESSSDWGVVCLFLEQFLPHFFSTHIEVTSKKDALEAARYGGHTLFFKPEVLANALLCREHSHPSIAHIPPHLRKRIINNASCKCKCDKHECQYLMQIFIRIMKLSAEEPKKIT